ncbi:MAG: thiamine phosphate synthase [Neomegalonema sp.]|nr:thiamine phosphate synthase [Neomegalonema sp.]
MAAHTTTQLYLTTPFMFEPRRFADDLSAALDAGPVACVRLRLRGASEDELKFAIETLRPICHSREVALIIADYYKLAAQTGLDGVHFEEAAPDIEEARKALGPDASIGASCGTSRHRGMSLGERGTDYVSFGPVRAPANLHNGELATRSLFEWWQAMIEIPVVAEGGITPDVAAELVGAADFVASCRAVWQHPEGPAQAIRAFHEAIERGPIAA